MILNVRLAGRRIPLTGLSHVDQSKAHTVQEGKNASDVRIRVDVCLEMIEAIKQSRAPSGVVLDSSKVMNEGRNEGRKEGMIEGRKEGMNE